MRYMNDNRLTVTTLLHFQRFQSFLQSCLNQLFVCFYLCKYRFMNMIATYLPNFYNTQMEKFSLLFMPEAQKFLSVFVFTLSFMLSVKHVVVNTT